MCGIAGAFSRFGADVDSDTIERMRDAVIERGPDDAGLFVERGIGLGHRRLSIIDLSPAGHGPMRSGDGRYWITYNGEVYNYRELRKELMDLGHRFHSATDTEVILEGYARWGADVFPRLRGMFGLAIWDSSADELVLARDAMGQKPVYYAEKGGRFYFGSNVRVVLEGLGETPEIDPAALDCYLSHSFIPSSHCIFSGIRKLPSAHFAKVSKNGFSLQRYWSMAIRPTTPLSFEESVERTDFLLQDAVRAHLVADVPVGAFLSGGVDSSTIVAMMSRLHGGPVRTFAIGFEEAAYSELPFAREVAQVCGTDHHEVVLRAADVSDVLPELVWQYGEPFGDSSAVPTYHVSRSVREVVKVALSGDGADELFAGYRYVRGELAAEYYRRLPESLRRRLLAPAAEWVESIRGHHGLAGSMATLAKKGIVEASRTHDNVLTWQRFRQHLYSPAFAAKVGGHDPLHDVSALYDEPTLARDVERRMHVDLAWLLPDDYLVKVDVASMAASLEVRTPFLDRVLVDEVLRLPVEHKLGLRTSKRLLKAVAARYVPRRVLDRPKQGFSLPVKSWLRGPLAPYLLHVVLSEKALGRGYFHQPVIERAVHEHINGRADHSVRLWLLLWLEVWHLMFVDRTFSRRDRLDALLT